MITFKIDFRFPYVIQMALSGDRLSVLTSASVVAERTYYQHIDQGAYRSYQHAARAFWLHIEKRVSYFSLDEVNTLKNLWREKLHIDVNGPPIITADVFTISENADDVADDVWDDAEHAEHADDIDEQENACYSSDDNCIND